MSHVDIVKYLFSEMARRLWKIHNGLKSLTLITLLAKLYISIMRCSGVFTFIFISGCPKLVAVLTGVLVSIESANRQRINASAEHIYQRLKPANILHYLVKWGAITNFDKEKIVAVEQKEGRATADLVFVLPNRKKNWFTIFLQALVHGENTELAEIIDPKKAKGIVKIFRISMLYMIQ